MDQPTWNLAEEIGGEARLIELMTRFYDRLFEDMMIGFFFVGKDKEHLIHSQIEYVSARLGDRGGEYTGPPIRKAHVKMPILVGHFDRRHQLLKEVLEEFGVPEHVRKAWLELDLSLRDLVVRGGAEARDEILRDQ
ncbi:MAG: group I truncated hemoglobin [Bradymonadaceae bacterium]